MSFRIAFALVAFALAALAGCGDERPEAKVGGSGGDGGIGGIGGLADGGGGVVAGGSGGQDGPRCGDGRLDPSEACDDGNNDSDDGCSADCELEFCGDGIAQKEEFCDGEDLRGSSCEERGFDGGVLACRGCKFDESDCFRLEVCDNAEDDDGDGLIDCLDDDCAEDPACDTCGDSVVQVHEECDGGPLITCIEAGFDDGVSSCQACRHDFGGCRNFVCGDGIVEGDEICDDGGNLPGDGCGPTCRSELPGDNCLTATELTPLWVPDEDGWIFSGSTAGLYADGLSSRCAPRDAKQPDVVAVWEAPEDGTYFFELQADFEATISVSYLVCEENEWSWCGETYFGKIIEKIPFSKGDLASIIVTPRGGSGGARVDGNYQLAVRNYPMAMHEREPNDDAASAQELALAGSMELREASLPIGDEDWFGFTIPGARAFQVWTERLGGGCFQDEIDTFIEVFDPSGAPVDSNDDDPRGAGGSLCSWLEFLPNQSGRHLVRITASPKQSQPTAIPEYRVAVVGLP